MQVGGRTSGVLVMKGLDRVSLEEWVGKNNLARGRVGCW